MDKDAAEPGQWKVVTVLVAVEEMRNGVQYEVGEMTPEVWT